MNEKSKFMTTKKWGNLIFGICVMVASALFSEKGFGFGSDPSLWWVGWVLAGAACCAQFMLSSDWRQINFSIILVALPAYVYSIHTNVLGFYTMRGGTGDWQEAYKDPLNVAGAIFMDLYPEIAIAWALGESKVGDFFGNLVKLYRDPNSLTSETRAETRREPMSIPQSIPRSYQQPLFKK